MKPLFIALALLSEASIQAGSPWAILWSGPGIIVASLMIAWGAEATQFFIAQGIALAVLALLQTLPEFAVEAVLAWQRQTPFLLANLTGALMLLTGLGWPLIYMAAATAYRREHKRPMRRIRLEGEMAVQIVALLAALAYEFVVWWKSSLNIVDGIVLIAIYIAYLWVMRRLPPEEPESIDEIAAIPRRIVQASKPVRIGSILALFAVGGAAVFLIAGPFLSALFGLATILGIGSFQFIQWVAPLVSEAPEGISAFYWARNPERAPIALMNMVSSNINQWTLLAAMLPVVLSISSGHITPIPLDALQSRNLLLTLAQSLLGAMFLMNMELAWWEAAGLFVLFVLQFAFSLGETGAKVHQWITWFYFAWAGVEVVRLISGNQKLEAWGHLKKVLAGEH